MTTKEDRDDVAAARKALSETGSRPYEEVRREIAEAGVGGTSVKTCAWCGEPMLLSAPYEDYCSTLCLDKSTEMISPREPPQKEPSGDPERDAPE